MTERDDNVFEDQPEDVLLKDDRPEVEGHVLLDKDGIAIDKGFVATDKGFSEGLATGPEDVQL